MAAVATQIYHPAKYDHHAVTSMSDIDVSARRLQELDGWSHIRSCIRDVFMRYNVNETFGIGLLHRHYDISPNEKIVELGSVATPWIVGDDEEITGGSVLPHTWRVHEGELKPTEFKFVAQRDVPGTQRAEFPVGFVQELIAIIESAGLEDVLGINMIKPDDEQEGTMEITYGRSSITIPAVETEGGKVIGPQPFEAFQAAWSFTGNDTGRTVSEGVEARHALCTKGLDEDNAGVQARHALCKKGIDSQDDAGVQARHALCTKGLDSQNIAGVQARHALCTKGIDSQDDAGVQARHALCTKGLDSQNIAGVQARHALCTRKIDTEDGPGVQAQHALCTKKLESDESTGVHTRHALCTKALDSGVKAQHALCTKALDSGVKARHALCTKALDSQDNAGVQARHALCTKALDSGVKTQHALCTKGLDTGVQARHALCTKKL